MRALVSDFYCSRAKNDWILTIFVLSAFNVVLLKMCISIYTVLSHSYGFCKSRENVKICHFEYWQLALIRLKAALGAKKNGERIILLTWTEAEI